MKTLNIDPFSEIDVYCDQCSTKLETDIAITPGGCVKILVEVCRKCNVEAHKSGYDTAVEAYRTLKFTKEEKNA